MTTSSSPDTPAPTSPSASSPEFTSLTVRRDGGVATVVLGRPQRANALDRTSWHELREVFRDLDADPSARVVVLRGAGGHFCAGIDLTMLHELRSMVPAGADPGRGRDDLRRTILDLQDVLRTVERCRVPVIAAIRGACVGAGLDLAAACDLRYATPDARFSIKEVDMGLAADVGVLQRLPHVIGEGRTREIAYTGRDVGGAEAAAMGLVNECLADEEALGAHVDELARSLAAKSPLALRGTKHAITYARDHSVADGLEQIATWNSAVLISDDLDEAVDAAAQKRTAVFPD